MSLNSSNLPLKVGVVGKRAIPDEEKGDEINLHEFVANGETQKEEDCDCESGGCEVLFVTMNSYFSIFRFFQTHR